MDQLVRYLKQRVPNNYIQIPDGIDQPENQEYFLSSLSSDIDSNPAYFKSIFKKILYKQELENFEIDDVFYSLYIEKLMPATELSPLDYDYLTYEVSHGESIIIKENPKLISGLNTTGLRTWELSIYLSYFLLNNYLPQYPQYRRVLELGTGTGLVGLSLNKCTDITTEVFMTDGDAQLVENLGSNFERNGIPIQKNNCFQYIWGDELPEIEFDLCVGADITYDISILEPLVISIGKMFENCKTRAALIACTVRNELTLSEFEKLLQIQGNGKFKYRLLHVINVDTMFVNPTSRFQIFEITTV